MVRACCIWFVIAGTAGGVKLLEPSVVIVTLFPDEYTRWRDRLPLDEALPFPAGASGIPLGWNAKLRVLGIVTGMTSKFAALSVTALGYDPRFNFSNTFWLLAGIAGVDPEFGTVGGATWCQYVLDGTAVRFVDPREAPKDWPTGWLPVNRDEPYGTPLPNTLERRAMVHELNSTLCNWAMSLTDSIQIPDYESCKEERSAYVSFPEATRPPSVKLGGTLAGDTFWFGKLTSAWARNWTRYWTNGKHSQFSTCAMEDFAVVEALNHLALAGRVRHTSNALLVLRAASNFVQPPAGLLPSEYQPSSKHFLVEPACETAFRVGHPVVLSLALANHGS